MKMSEQISTLSGRKLLSLGLKEFLWIFLAAIGPDGMVQLCSEWLLELDGSHSLCISCFRDLLCKKMFAIFVNPR